MPHRHRRCCCSLDLCLATVRRARHTDDQRSRRDRAPLPDADFRRSEAASPASRGYEVRRYVRACWPQYLLAFARRQIACFGASIFLNTSCMFCIASAIAIAAIETSRKTTSKFAKSKNTIASKRVAAAAEGKNIFQPERIQSAITTSSAPKLCKRTRSGMPPTCAATRTNGGKYPSHDSGLPSAFTGG